MSEQLDQLDKPASWCIQIVYCDTKENRFLTLGGACWLTEAEWEVHWASIPESPFGSEDPAMLVADKLDDEDTIVADRYITAETASILMGKSVDDLIAEAHLRDKQSGAIQ